MGRIIAVASGKGGVGKTTLVSNLATSLARFNRRVIVVDGNLSTPNLGLHLGVSLSPVTIHDVLEGIADVNEALFYHEHGFHLLPADISIRTPKKIPPKNIEKMLYKLSEMADIVIVDTSAGLGKETLQFLRAADEVITITNPNLPSVTDALKLNTLAMKHETAPTGVVINRVMGHPFEMSEDEVMDFLGLPILGKIPEDRWVHKSVAAKTPVVIHAPKSLAAQHFMAIAARIIGEEYTPKRYLSHLILDWFRK